QDDRRALAGDPVDGTASVQDDLPLLELGHRTGTLAKGHTAPADAAPDHDPDQPLLREGPLGAAARGHRLPRGAPRAGPPPLLRPPRGWRPDGTGAGHARRRDRRV